jgi:zinc protease
MNLAYHALLGNPDGINLEAEHIQAVTSEQIHQIAKQVLRPDNCSTLHYKSKNNNS